MFDLALKKSTSTATLELKPLVVGHGAWSELTDSAIQILRGSEAAKWGPASIDGTYDLFVDTDGRIDSEAA